jgi:SIR2-like domain
MTIDDTSAREVSGSIALPIPTPGVDNRVALAMGIQAAPGAYAVLAGSGMSRAAHVPTAWDVVRDLIRKVAAAEGADLGDLVDSPEDWWEKQGRGEPGYDTLLEQLASTDAARQRLLAGYFESAEPTTAHHELAQHVAPGRVRLILTTNLDRLMERALDHAGVVPQVIVAPEQVKAMMPLTHAPATLVKLHGDYRMLGSRNTTEELANYPPEWEALLARIFEEYGLVTIGWSGEYDTALVSALASAPRHAFPCFWVSYNNELSEAAKRVIGLRHAAVIDSTGADEFLVDLGQRIARLDQAAARRGRPQRLLTFPLHLHESNIPEPGWAINPLLQVRVVSLAGPVQLGESPGIGPEQREALCERLRQAAATHRVRALAVMPAAYAAELSAESDPPEVTSPGDWHPTPIPYQSSGLASYRLGGDGEAGVSALARVELPTRTNYVTFTADCGLSVQRQLHLFELALLLRDYLVLSSGPMFDAFIDVLPADVEIYQAQLYVAAPGHLDVGGRQRENDLPRRVDLTPLGETDQPPAKMLRYAVANVGPLVERDASEIVVDAIRQTALDQGYLDPRNGVTQLRAQMGLAAAAHA